jgi:spore coat protein JB
VDKSYCGCNHNERVTQNCVNLLLSELRQIDFAIVETTLYLDVYPDCAEARKYICELREKRAKVAAEYESKHGMLTMYGACGGSSDKCSPWPWEYAAN